MPYRCELGAGQSLYLDNQGTQTIVTQVSHRAGQQQQASSSFQTGRWTAPPQVVQTPDGVMVKVAAEQGDCTIQIQGSSMQVASGIPAASRSHSLQMQQVDSIPATLMPGIKPMEPMEPLPPMIMGDMQMSMNPMQMRMGNMELRMGEPSSPTASHSQFCSQCGTAIAADDRFCRNCGQRLS